MSFVGQVRPQVVDIFATTAKYFPFFFTPQKNLFSLSTISNVETKAFSFLLRIPNPPRLFSFPNDFRGNAEHFSKMQIQRNRCENTRAGSSPSKILEKQPNFPSTVQQRRTWPAAAFFNNESKKLSTKEICATSKDFATIPTAKRNPSKVGELYVGLISIKKNSSPHFSSHRYL